VVRCVATAAALIITASPAPAQNWDFDARTIALGSAGGRENLASRMIAEELDYRAIVLPFGLLQVLRDLDVFNPDSEEFDVVRSIEYAASPIHYIVNRDTSESEAGRQLVVDLRNATISRDLNAYRGFVPVEQPVAEGLAAPSFGGTIKVSRGPGESFQGIYVGAGPYFSMRNALTVDPDLTALLGSETDVYLANTRFDMANAARAQMALAITGGYRGRFTAAGRQGAADGVYVAVDYHYLHGFRYEDVDMALALDTDAAGLITIAPQSPPAVAVARRHADSGKGFAIDAGIGIVANRWEVGFGVNGIANRIEWRDVQQTTRVLGNVLLGEEFVETPDVQIGDARVELPKDYRVNLGYRGGAWSALAEYGHGFQESSFRGGLEIRGGALDLRGGGLYSREQWHPTAGIGLNFGPRVSLDVAIFGTSANIERRRKAAIATSLRFNR
jgi:hypothetical protein